MRLSKRTAIVTGAASGIGRAIAIRATQEGADIAVVDVDMARGEAVTSQLRALGGKAQFFECDLSQVDAHAVFDRVEKSMGKIDTLFNNAGIGIVATAPDTTNEAYRRTMSINVDAPWYLSREFIARRRTEGLGGVIVNIASVNAWYVEPSYAVYCTSKGAVFAMTKAMAFDHAREGFRINCVCPGWVETGFTAPVLDAAPDPALARAQAGATHAIGRIGRPEEIASAAIFLASDDASFCCGTAFAVDGGMTLGVAVAT